jgi:hypothetical protein
LSLISDNAVAGRAQGELLRGRRDHDKVKAIAMINAF